MLRAFSASNGSANPRPSELVALGLAEAAKATFVVLHSLSREPPKLQQTQPLLAAWDRYRALLPSCDTRCWRAKLGTRHADLLREATVIATPASAPCMILQCGAWYGCVAVWPCGCVFGGGMNGAIGSKNTCKTFSTELFDWSHPVEKVGFFDWIRQSQFSVEKALFRLRKKARFGLQSKRPFSTDKSDCVRNGLTLLFLSFPFFAFFFSFFFCLLSSFLFFHLT